MSGTTHPLNEEHKIEQCHNTGIALSNILTHADTNYVVHNPVEDVAIAEQLFESLIPHDMIQQLSSTIAKQLAYSRKRDNLVSMRDNRIYPKSFNVHPIKLDPHSLNDDQANTVLMETFTAAFDNYRTTLLNAMISTIDERCQTMLKITANDQRERFLLQAFEQKALEYNVQLLQDTAKQILAAKRDNFIKQTLAQLYEDYDERFNHQTQKMTPNDILLQRIRSLEQQNANLRRQPRIQPFSNGIPIQHEIIARDQITVAAHDTGTTLTTQHGENPKYKYTVSSFSAEIRYEAVNWKSATATTRNVIINST